MKIRRICNEDCYPPIDFYSDVLSIDGATVLAVAVPHSVYRPHFAGAAYVRRGSQSVTATEDKYEGLILSRQAIVRELLKLRGQTSTVRLVGKKLGSFEMVSKDYLARSDCRVLDCTAHYVRLEVVGQGTRISEVLENVLLSYDDKRHRPMLVVRRSDLRR